MGRTQLEVEMNISHYSKISRLTLVKRFFSQSKVSQPKCLLVISQSLVNDFVAY